MRGASATLLYFKRSYGVKLPMWEPKHERTCLIRKTVQSCYGHAYPQRYHAGRDVLAVGRSPSWRAHHPPPGSSVYAPENDPPEFALGRSPASIRRVFKTYNSGIYIVKSEIGL